MYLRAIDGRAHSDCPMSDVARSGGTGTAYSRQLASALNCALLSGCVASIPCLEHVARLVERHAGDTP